MHRTLILIAGLITMALLAIWCLDTHVAEIQTDILNRSNDALAGTERPLRATVSGQDVTLSGVVASEQARVEAGSLVAALAGVRVVDNQITVEAPPAELTGPYRFEASFVSNQLILSGSVSDDAERASLVGAARQIFRGHQVIDELGLRGGAPAGFAGAVRAALPQLASLTEGRLLFGDQRVTLTGVAPSTQTMQLVERELAAGLPVGYSASAQLRLTPGSAARVAECQLGFDRIMAGRTIRFTTGSARINADSFPLLDEVAAAAKDCSGIAIEVQGHTDSQGAAESNLALSQRRAEAVVDYLMREGVALGQLVARGYGESLPRESNDTVAGRASNRRIDFRAGVTEDSEQ